MCRDLVFGSSYEHMDLLLLRMCHTFVSSPCAEYSVMKTSHVRQASAPCGKVPITGHVQTMTHSSSSSFLMRSNHFYCYPFYMLSTKLESDNIKMKIYNPHSIRNWKLAMYRLSDRRGAKKERQNRKNFCLTWPVGSIRGWVTGGISCPELWSISRGSPSTKSRERLTRFPKKKKSMCKGPEVWQKIAHLEQQRYSA